MKLRVCFFAAWLFLLLFSVSKHVSWRDEYQSWLVSTRTELTKDFIEAVRYERHPPVHYLLQKGLYNAFPENHKIPARWGIYIVSGFFTVGVAFLLFFACDLTLFQSIAFSCNIYCFREFGVISRCYPIGFFFMLMAVWFWKKNRYALMNTMLLVSAGTHLLFTIAAGSFWIASLLKRNGFKKCLHWRECLTVGILFLGILWFQKPPIDSHFPSDIDFSLSSLFKIPFYGTQALFHLQSFQPHSVFYSENIFVFLCVSTFSGFYIFWFSNKKTLFTTSFVFFPVLFIVSIRAGGIPADRYMGVVFAAFLSGFLAFNAKQHIFKWPWKWHELSPCACVGLCVSLLWWTTWAPYKKTPSFDFSGTQELIQHVPEISDQNALLLSYPSYLFFPWMAQTNSDVFEIKHNKWMHYPYFKKQPEISLESWCQLYLADFIRMHPNKKIYLGAHLQQDIPKSCGVEKTVFKTQRPVVGTDEIFAVYALKGDT
jgi:hypothetical protein